MTTMRRLIFLLAVLAVAHPARTADFAGRFDELKKGASPSQLYTLLYDLPKGGDLHNHGGGADLAEWVFDICVDPARNGSDTFYTRAHLVAEPDTIAPGARYHTIRKRTYDRLAAVARAEYVALPELTPAERTAWCNSLRLDAPGEGREEFFQAIWPRRGEIGRNLPVKLELLAENVKAFAAEGVRYLEIMFGADGFETNDGHAIPNDEAAAAIRRRLAQPDLVGPGLVVRFLDAIIRFRPDAEAKLADAYAFVDGHRDLWVGLNMAGIEDNGRGNPKRFLETFRQLRSLYPTLALSIHAGEMDGPDTHIRDTLLLGASRIGHGVNLIYDSDTLLLLQQTRRVLIEINLISNRLLEYTPDLTRHPFPEYLRTGVPVCLNTDDRGMWDSNLTDEYYTAVTLYHLSWEEIVQLGRNSLVFSFAQPEVKAKLLADYEARVAAFVAKYGAGSTTDALDRLRTVKPVTYGYAKRNWSLEFK